MKKNGKEVKHIVLRKPNDGDDVVYIGSQEIINDTDYSIVIVYEDGSTEKFE